MTAIVSYGAGTNSTALLCGLVERNERPDAILFADTENEKPGTYEYKWRFSEWLWRQGFPQITTVRRLSHYASLEDECRVLETLPSKVFGNAGCSVKWKRQPMDKWILARFSPPIVRFIGIHYGEQWRGQIPSDDTFQYRFPLIEWRWGQEECIAVIKRHGLPLPMKSACWFCPSSKKKEVVRLSRSHPELFNRAVAMEHNAAKNLDVVVGLGRNWSWEEIVRDHRKYKAAHDATDQMCLCYDGDESV